MSVKLKLLENYLQYYVNRNVNSHWADTVEYRMITLVNGKNVFYSCLIALK